MLDIRANANYTHAIKDPWVHPISSKPGRMRTPRHVDPREYEDEDAGSHPIVGDLPDLEVTTDDDRDTIGWILDRHGHPMHQVKHPSAVPFGYQPRTR